MSHGLPSASWRARKANDIIPSESEGSDDRGQKMDILAPREDRPFALPPFFVLFGPSWIGFLFKPERVDLLDSVY